MAKSKSFFGLRRGSTKSHTYQISAFGDQITKDRVVEVKNPRTKSQMENRMIIATVSAGYSAMRAIADHSFEGVSYGAASMAKFCKLNISAIRAGMADGEFDFGFNPYRNRNLHPGAYVIAKGSLPAVPVFDGNLDGAANRVGLSFYDTSGRPQIILNAAGGAFTANSLMSALNARVGDMITCVAIVKKTAGGYGFVYVRIKFIAAGTTLITDANKADYIAVESNVPVATAFEDGTGLTFTLNASWDSDVRTAGDNKYPRAAFGFIHSQYADGAWLRSDCTLDVSGWTTGIPEGWDDALATYPLGQEYILNGGD